MLNVRNLVVDAFKMIGDIGDQEALDGTRTLVGVQLLNEIISRYNLDNYFAFTQITNVYPVTESKKEYSIGIPTTSADTTDINIDRPASITRLYIKQGESVTQEVRGVSLQDLPLFDSSGSGTPCAFSYQSTYPYSNLVFDIKPNTNQSLVMIYPKALPILTVNDVAEIPYEYEPLLKYSLAHLLAKRYGDEPSVVLDMKELRDELLKSISQNTARKSEAILHAGSYSNRNIYNLFPYR
jgi:hypothetical protein